jgi:uncharacterized repeat protein (TIGR01451 family)
MKKLLLLLLLAFTTNFYGQFITPLVSPCFDSTFNLNLKNFELVNNQNPNDFVVTFYLSQIDATSATNPIANPSAFSGGNGQIIFARILNVLTNVSTTNNFMLQQPPPIIATITSSGNTVTINATGGLPPYVFSINSGPWFTTSFSPSNTFNLPPGFYVFTVQDINGCTFTTSPVTIIENINATYTAAYQDFNADGFTNVGDVVNYNFTIINNSNVALTNVTMTSNSSTIVGGPITSLNAGAQNNTTFTGVHVITQSDINQGFVALNATVSGSINGVVQTKNVFGSITLNLSNGIKLNAFLDTNGNGIQDGGEPNFFQGNFSSQLNSGVIHNITTSNGIHYIYESNPLNSYNFGFSINNQSACQYTISTPIYNNISVANSSGITTLNFPVIALPCIDLGVYLTGNPPRPGFTYDNFITIANNGNTSITSGTVTFNKNNIVSILSVSQSGAIINPNGFTYNFTNLLPFEQRTIVVTMQVPTIPTVSLGQQLTNSASITIPTGDINILNNNTILIQTIVGSYDPNEKEESHGGKILKSSFTANDYLTYKIQFENTGTADAINIRVNDLLDAKLDETSIRMIASSHPYTLDRNGKNLEWKFAGINLPPSIANTQIGHGYVVFQIKPISGFAVGDIIPNVANIYFDFNPAIVTNICTTEFVSALSSESFVFNNLKIYPNPIKNEFNISQNEEISEISFYSVLGQMVFMKVINSNKSNIDISGLSSGTYFVKIKTGDNFKNFKIIKE